MAILFIRPIKTRWKWEKRRKGKLKFFSGFFGVKSCWFSNMEGRSWWLPSFRASCHDKSFFQGDGYQNLLKMLEFGGKKKSKSLSTVLRKFGEKNGGNGPGNAIMVPRLCF